MFRVDPYEPFKFSKEASGLTIRSVDPTICRVQALLLPLLHKKADFDNILFRYVGAIKDGDYVLEGTVKRLKLVLHDGCLKDFVFCT